MGTCPTRCRSRMETLENTVELSSTQAQETVVVSLYDYPAYGLAGVTVCIGEKVTVVSDDGEFLMVKSSTTGRETYLPSNYTAKVNDRWLFTGINRYKAEELLMRPENRTGAFLIRESETMRDCYSLSVVRRAAASYLDCVKHYRVQHLQNGWFYISPGLTFPSLHHLVQHYSDSADGLCSRLTEPCFIRGLDHSRDTAGVPTMIHRPTIKWRDVTKSMIFRGKRTASENSLVSEGLRDAMTSYLEMTGSSAQNWDT